MYLKLDLTLPSQHSFVRTTRRAIGGYLDDLGVSPRLRDDLVLAIDEACTNVVQHAFPAGEGFSQGQGAILLEMELTPREVRIEVRDAGVGFEAFEQPVAPRGRLAISGRGIEIMRRLVDSVELESPSPAGGTRIRLRQSLPAPAARP